MYGSWLLNFFSSVAILLFYFSISIFHKTLLRSVIESIVAAVIFFLICYYFRWAISFFSRDHSIETDVNIQLDFQDHLPTEPFVKPDLELSEDEVELTADYIKNMLNNEK